MGKVTQLREGVLPSDHTSLFTPNPHLNKGHLSVSHALDISKKVKKGYHQEIVTLEHYSNRGTFRGYQLGTVTTKGITPKKAQHRIMCGVFGLDSEGLVVRDKNVLNLMADFLGTPFTMVSNRTLRSVGLVEWAMTHNCTAVYTPEGYDDILLETLNDYINLKGYRLKLITYMDGGLLYVN